MSTPNLATYPVTELKGVGPKAAERLAKLGIQSVQDMLFHLPLRYEDRARTILSASYKRIAMSALKPRLSAVKSHTASAACWYVMLMMERGGSRCVFSILTRRKKNAMQAGKIIRCFGEVRRGRHGFEMAHPEYSIKETRSAPCDPSLATLTPVYPTTEGLKQLSIRAIADQAVELLRKYDVPDYLPAQYRPSQQSLKEALLLLHRPPQEVDLTQLELGQHPAQARLAFEELLAQNLSLLKLGKKVKR